MDICLLCLELRNDSNEVIQVQSNQWRDENIEKLIEKHFWSMKTIKDNAWLCTSCWHAVSEFHRFYVRIEDAHVYLTSMLKTETQESYEYDEQCLGNHAQYELELSTDTAPVHTHFTSMMKRETQDNNEFGEEYRDNELRSVTNALHDVQYHLDPTQVAAANVAAHEDDILLFIKQENDNEDQVINNDVIKPLRQRSKCEKDPLENCTSASEHITLSKKIFNKNESKKSKKSTFSNAQNTHDDDEKAAEEVNSDSQTDSENHTDNSEETDEEGATRSNPKYRGQDEFIAENFKINCGICQLEMKTFHDVCKHSAAEHKQRGFVLCCNKKFSRLRILVEHIHWHLDPEYFKCNDCGKVMADRRCLNLHARVHEKLDQTHVCDVCGKAFARALALQRHKLIHLPEEEKKYSCDQCGKNFGGNKALSNHIRSVHLNKYALVCDICGRRMRSKDVFERHMLQHEGLPIPTVSCDVCGLKMIDARSLKRHKEIQHPEGGRIEYKCNICSKISPTLKAHKKHVQYQHELGHNFKCTVCAKAFKRAISLTEHMATHTGTVLYTCAYCPKTFNSNANMHNHRKKVHPKEWEDACREKYSGNLPPHFTNK